MKTKVSINYLKRGDLKATIFDKDRKELALLPIDENENGYDFEKVYKQGKLVENAYGITANYYIDGQVSSSIYLNFY